MIDYEDLTSESFTKKGIELFGENKLLWKFQCPICSNVQTAEDFRKFKDKGASANCVYQECIGRYMPKEQVTTAFGKKNKSIKSPCDYASYGLFQIGHKVTFPDGKTICVFPFAKGDLK